jgi:hypothetical protein
MSNQQASIAPYLGVVATRGAFPNQLDAAHGTAMMSRSFHRTMVGVSGLQIVIPNFWVNGAAGETAPGQAATVTASIEYPAGVFSQIKFAGATSGSVLNNSTLLSDVVPVTIPAKTGFWVRIFFNPGVASLPFKSDGLKATVLGDAQTITGATDQTLSGTVVDGGGANFWFGPAAIIGVTSQPSFLLAGDSRVANSHDSVNDNTGDMGLLARTVGAKYGYINGGTSADTINAWAGGLATNRIALASWVSHVVCQLGLNDVGAGSLIETTKSNYLRFHNLLPPTCKFILSTIPANSASSDSWATISGQKPTGFFTEGKNSTLFLLNDWMRGAVSGSGAYGVGVGDRPAWVDGVIEIADVLMYARESNKWVVTGAAGGITDDGIHPTQAGCLLLAAALQNSNAIDNVAFSISPSYEAARNPRLAGTTDKDGVVTPAMQLVSPLPNSLALAITPVNVTNVSTTILAANPNAKYRCIKNPSAGTITLNFHVAAVAGTGIVLNPAAATGPLDQYEMYDAKGNMDRREITAIASAAGPFLLSIVEVQ